MLAGDLDSPPRQSPEIQRGISCGQGRCYDGLQAEGSPQEPSKNKEAVSFSTNQEKKQSEREPPGQHLPPAQHRPPGGSETCCNMNVSPASPLRPILRKTSMNSEVSHGRLSPQCHIRCSKIPIIQKTREVAVDQKTGSDPKVYFISQNRSNTWSDEDDEAGSCRHGDGRRSLSCSPESHKHKKLTSSMSDSPRQKTRFALTDQVEEFFVSSKTVIQQASGQHSVGEPESSSSLNSASSYRQYGNSSTRSSSTGSKTKKSSARKHLRYRTIWVESDDTQFISRMTVSANETSRNIPHQAGKINVSDIATPVRKRSKTLTPSLERQNQILTKPTHSVKKASTPRKQSSKQSDISILSEQSEKTVSTRTKLRKKTPSPLTIRTNIKTPPPPRRYRINKTPSPRTIQKSKTPSPPIRCGSHIPPSSIKSRNKTPSPLMKHKSKTPSPLMRQMKTKTPSPSSISRHKTPPFSTLQRHKTPPFSFISRHKTPPLSSISGHKTPPPSLIPGHKSPPPSSISGHKNPTPSSISGHKSPPVSSISGHKTPPASSISGHKSPPRTPKLRKKTSPPLRKQTIKTASPPPTTRPKADSSSLKPTKISFSPDAKPVHQLPPPHKEPIYQRLSPCSETLGKGISVNGKHPQPDSSEKHLSNSSLQSSSPAKMASPDHVEVTKDGHTTQRKMMEKEYSDNPTTFNNPAVDEEATRAQDAQTTPLKSNDQTIEAVPLNKTSTEEKEKKLEQLEENILECGKEGKVNKVESIKLNVSPGEQVKVSETPETHEAVSGGMLLKTGENIITQEPKSLSCRESSFVTPSEIKEKVLEISGDVLKPHESPCTKISKIEEEANSLIFHESNSVRSSEILGAAVDMSGDVTKRHDSPCWKIHKVEKGEQELCILSRVESDSLELSVSPSSYLRENLSETRDIAAPPEPSIIFDKEQESRPKSCEISSFVAPPETREKVLEMTGDATKTHGSPCLKNQKVEKDEHQEHCNLFREGSTNKKRSVSPLAYLREKLFKSRDIATLPEPSPMQDKEGSPPVLLDSTTIETGVVKKASQTSVSSNEDSSFHTVREPIMEAPIKTEGMTKTESISPLGKGQMNFEMIVGSSHRSIMPETGKPGSVDDSTVLNTLDVVKKEQEVSENQAPNTSPDHKTLKVRKHGSPVDPLALRKVLHKKESAFPKTFNPTILLQPPPTLTEGSPVDPKTYHDKSPKINGKRTAVPRQKKSKDAKAKCTPIPRNNTALKFSPPTYKDIPSYDSLLRKAEELTLAAHGQSVNSAGKSLPPPIIIIAKSSPNLMVPKSSPKEIRPTAKLVAETGDIAENTEFHKNLTEPLSDGGDKKTDSEEAHDIAKDLFELLRRVPYDSEDTPCKYSDEVNSDDSNEETLVERDSSSYSIRSNTRYPQISSSEHSSCFSTESVNSPRQSTSLSDQMLRQGKTSSSETTAPMARPPSRLFFERKRTSSRRQITRSQCGKSGESGLRKRMYGVRRSVSVPSSVLESNRSSPKVGGGKPTSCPYCLRTSSSSSLVWKTNSWAPIYGIQIITAALKSKTGQQSGQKEKPRDDKTDKGKDEQPVGVSALQSRLPGLAIGRDKMVHQPFECQQGEHPTGVAQQNGTVAAQMASNFQNSFANFASIISAQKQMVKTVFDFSLQHFPHFRKEVKEQAPTLSAPVTSKERAEKISRAVDNCTLQVNGVHKLKDGKEITNFRGACILQHSLKTSLPCDEKMENETIDSRRSEPQTSDTNRGDIDTMDDQHGEHWAAFLNNRISEISSFVSDIRQMSTRFQITSLNRFSPFQREETEQAAPLGPQRTGNTTPENDRVAVENGFRSWNIQTCSQELLSGFWTQRSNMASVKAAQSLVVETWQQGCVKEWWQAVLLVLIILYILYLLFNIYCSCNNSMCQHCYDDFVRWITSLAQKFVTVTHYTPVPL